MAEAGAEVPDDPEMEVDLRGLQYGYSSKQQIQLICQIPQLDTFGPDGDHLVTTGCPFSRETPRFVGDLTVIKLQG